MTTQCCVCHKHKHTGNEWLQKVPEGFDPHGVSHTYCPPCAKQARAEMFAPSRAQFQLATA